MVTLCARVGWPDGLSGKIGAAVIKAAQPSRIYHTGLLLSDGWLYQSRMQQGVHRSRFDVSNPDWIKVECPWADEQYALDYYNARANEGYDFPGLFDWGLRRVVKTVFGRDIRPGIEDPNLNICSEFNGGQLHLSDPIRFSPSALVRECYRRTQEYYA